ncbi:MAG: roadblock/LC7 domain-containing protein [Anaerolineales bacterium]|jgi:predicted regulator of Ras-like GTPase activity (Roadblock/LC7/MglB family)
MRNYLEEINGVVGVTGSFLCRSDGSLIDTVLPEALSEETLLSVSRTLAKTLEGLRLARHRKVTEMDLAYESGRLVVKNLGETYLIILCTPNINVSLLNLTANLVVKKMQEALKASGIPSPKAASSNLAPQPELPTQPVAVAAPTVAVTAPRPLRLQAALDIVTAARGSRVVLRVMGEGALRLRCPSVADKPSRPEEEDTVELAARSGQSVEGILKSLGYIGDSRFNTLFGSDRMRFAHPQTRVYVEIYYDHVASYHRLEIGSRVHLDDVTLPLADLLLSQLQNVEANEEDFWRLAAVLIDHDLGGPGQPEAIDATRVLALCSDDWGWCKTVTMNLEKCLEWGPKKVPATLLPGFQQRTARLHEMIEDAPKSLRWQTRARVGERQRWYELPE